MNSDQNADPDVDADDALLLWQIGSSVDRSDPVPAEVRDYARLAIEIGRIDADLVELTTSELVGQTVRSEPGRSETVPEMYTFEAGEFELEIQLVESAPRRWTLIGQVVPTDGIVQVSLRRGDGTSMETATDRHGQFQFADLAAGPASLALVSSVTEWITIGSSVD